MCGPCAHSLNLLSSAHPPPGRAILTYIVQHNSPKYTEKLGGSRLTDHSILTKLWVDANLTQVRARSGQPIQLHTASVSGPEACPLGVS